MKNVRRGLGKGLGMGYKNLVPIDSHIHALSSRGIKSAQQIFREAYPSGDKNFITPHVLKLGKAKTTRAYELSKGEFLGDDIYGVTVIDDVEGIEKRHDLSKSFNSKKEDEEYIKTLSTLNARSNMNTIQLDREYSVITYSEGTRNGFRHVAILMRNGNEVDKATENYLNRTWESYEFQTVLHKLLDKDFEKDKAKMLKEDVDKTSGRSIYLNAKRGVPEGWAFIDWKDSLGKTWKDSVPKGYLNIFQHNVWSKGGKILKVKLGAKGYDIASHLKHSKLPDSKFDRTQLKKGMKVEMEHTTSKKVAKAIAKAHLLESPSYYKALSKMEKTLNAMSIKTPTVQVLKAKDFDTRFKDDYEPYEQGYATTKITPDGTAKVFVRDDGNKDYSKEGKLLMHELKEIEIFKKLVKKGVNPQIADEMAHNLNPVKVAGVSKYYPLNLNN